jgi:fluoride exporter
MNYLVIFFGGGLGAVCRFFVASLVNQRVGILFPIGTFSVNVIGSFIMGVLFSLFQNITVSLETRALLTIGFLGGFTTFSSFSIETVNLLRDGEYRLFLYNLVFTNVTCLLVTISGLYSARLFTRFIRQG